MTYFPRARDRHHYILRSHLNDDACMDDDSEIFAEHDFDGGTICRRCGAEPVDELPPEETE